MERIKLTNKRSENAEKELRISDVLRSFYDYHWKRTDVVEKFYDYHWKNQIKIAYNGRGYEIVAEYEARNYRTPQSYIRATTLQVCITTAMFYSLC